MRTLYAISQNTSYNLHEEITYNVTIHSQCPLPWSRKTK